MKQKATLTLVLMAIVALVVWFAPGTAATVEGVVLDLLMAIGY
jgi:hypothetical protein